MSARRSAGASLTPSPVIATTCPCARSASAICSLASGEARAKITSRPPASDLLHLRARDGGRAAGVDDDGVLAADSDLAGDRRGGQGMIAGDDDDADPCAVTAGDRLTDLGAGRVEHRDQTRGSTARARPPRASGAAAPAGSGPPGERQHAQPVLRVRLDPLLMRSRSAASSGRSPAAAGEAPCAAGQHRLRGALGVKPLAPGSKLERRHQLQLRVEVVPMRDVAASRRSASMSAPSARAASSSATSVGSPVACAVGLEPRVVASRRRLGERRQRSGTRAGGRLRSVRLDAPLRRPWSTLRSGASGSRSASRSCRCRSRRWSRASRPRSSA